MIMSTAEATQERINVQAGEYDGDVGEYLGLDGDAGEVGEYFGLVGEYLGLVGLICAGLVGESGGHRQCTNKERKKDNDNVHLGDTGLKLGLAGE